MEVNRDGLADGFRESCIIGRDDGSSDFVGLPDPIIDGTADGRSD